MPGTLYRTFVLLVLMGTLTASALAQDLKVLDFWVEGGANTAGYMTELVEAFEADNPDIDVRLQVIPSSQYANSVNLAFRSGDQPDVLRCALGSTQLPRCVEEGWALPLDRFVDDALLSRFYPDQILEGTVRFGGKLYSLPKIRAGAQDAAFLFYNKELLAEAGFSEPPSTWDEMREYANQLTETGGGRYYGWGMYARTPATFAQYLAMTDGWTGLFNRAISFDTGRADALNPSFVKAVELLRAMNLEDRSVLPGWESLDYNGITSAFAQGQVAMYLGQGFHASLITGEPGNMDPENLGITTVPTPDGQIRTKFSLSPASGFYIISSQTEFPEEAWKLMTFLYSDRGFEYEIVNQDPFPAVRTLSERLDELSPEAAPLNQALEAQSVVAPNPILRSPDWATVDALYESPVPNFPDLLTAAIQGQGNYEEDAARFNETMDTAYDAAIAAAQREGAAVCRELLAFPNFNGTENYTAQDYEGLPGCP